MLISFYLSYYVQELLFCNIQYFVAIHGRQTTMANVEDVFKVSIEQEMCDVSYYHHIAHHRSELIHKVPWGGAIIRNSSPSGELLNFRIARDFEIFHKETNMELWLLLSLKVFRHDGSLYGVYCCSQCNSMAGTEQLSIDQDPQNILPRLCMHSRVASTILDDWRNIWDVEISDDDRVARIICNEEIKLHTFLEQRVDQVLLGAVRTSDCAVHCHYPPDYSHLLSLRNQKVSSLLFPQEK